MNYHEFLIFIIRIANKLYEDKKDQGLEYKVANVIVQMYEAEGILDPIKAKIRSPELDISY
jgi:hypothetical protein